MPTTQSARDLILKSSFAGPTDASEAAAAGRLLRGRERDDVLRATSDDGWWIEGRGGDDEIRGARGNDLLVANRARLADAGTDGDPDTDDAVGLGDPGPRDPAAGTFRVTIDGEGGDDLILGDASDDMLKGGTGDDSLRGFDGEDQLIGGKGDDVMAAGRGNATIEGGEGLDTYSWADLAGGRDRGGLAGVVLNLSDRLIRYDSGDQVGEGQILVADGAGGFVLLGEADTMRTRADLRPEGQVSFDIAANTAQIEVGGPLPATQKFADAGEPNTTERYEGTDGKSDVAVLADGFALVETLAGGWQRWSDGTQTLEFRGFEVILIA